MAIDLGEIDSEAGAESLGLTLEQLDQYLAKHPGIESQASQLAQVARTDPNRAVQHSLEGLVAVAATLSRRVSQDGESMTTYELTATGALLDKISATSAAKALEAKAQTAPDQEDTPQPLPAVITDNRGGNLTIYMLPPEHPATKELALKKYDPNESEESRAARSHGWLNRWFPMNAEGEVLNLARLIGPGGAFIDDAGVRHDC